MKKLTENHPLSIKLRALEEYMNDNNIRIELNDYGKINIIDTETNVEVMYHDLENHRIYSFPSDYETRLILSE